MSAFYEKGNFYVYDPGFRLQGGGFHITLKGVNGFDQIEMLIHFALTGRMDCYNLDKLNDPLLHGQNAANIWFLLKPGIIKQIEGFDYIKIISQCILFKIDLTLGMKSRNKCKVQNDRCMPAFFCDVKIKQN